VAVKRRLGQTRRYSRRQDVASASFFHLARSPLPGRFASFVLDQRISAARARRELAWKPGARDVLADLSAGG
jgi:hypothetical protein